MIGLLSVGVLVAALISEGATGKPGTEAPAPAAAEAPAPAVAPAPPAPPTVTVDDLKTLQGAVGAMTQRIDQLEKQIAASPRSQPVPDLKPLQARVDDLSKLPDLVAPLPRRVGELDGRIGSLDKDLGTLKSEVASLQEQVKRRPEPAATPKPEESAEPAADIEAALTPAAGLVRQRRYADALGTLQELQRTHPEDARVWYYSALASGFVTNKWDGEAARLVEKGVEREKAGTPAAARIDAAFADLTTATGKQWLDHHRQRARK